MTYFADLSDYVYDRARREGVVARNVGWLDAGAPFEISEPTPEFLESLWQHCELSVLQTRGLHECHLCPPHASNVVERRGKKLLLGSAEIRVFSKTGEIYAAPNLIYHYVSVHKYRPPGQFVDAVLAGLSPKSSEYLHRLTELGLAWAATLVPSDRPLRMRLVRSEDGEIKKVEE